MVRPNVRNVANSPSDAHSTLTTQQMLGVGNVMRTKSVGFGCNSSFHNKIMVVGLVWEICRTHQNWEYCNISKWRSTPLRIVSNAQTASDVPNHVFLLTFWRIKQICDTWCLNFFYVGVDVKFAIFSYTESVKSHFLTQNIEYSNKTWNVFIDLKNLSKY